MQDPPTLKYGAYCTPEQALANHKEYLMAVEAREILSYQQVFYFGIALSFQKSVIFSPANDTNNNGFDTDDRSLLYRTRKSSVLNE